MPVMKKVKSKNSAKLDQTFREIVYPEVVANVCQGDTAISVSDCKQLLGWEEEGETKFGSEYLLKDNYGNKIRCSNNVTNRPLYRAVLDGLVQEHLRRRWKFNGEPIIIGETGLILNGQHTMISLILAAQTWEQEKEKWQEYWTTEPTMEKMVISGISESDDTVNTMDTCKPRSLADVIYRSEFFATLPTSDRKQCSRITDYAIKLMWYRTGACLDAWAPRRTHSESLDFMNRHPKLLACVKHIFEENGDENKIGAYLPPGNAAGLLYLMGCSASDAEPYRLAANPSEDSLNWDNWGKACDFWVMLAGADKSMGAIRDTLAYMNEEREGGSSPAEKWAVIAQAWNTFIEGNPITKDDLILEYDTDPETLTKQLVEHPTVGGIDLGNPKEIDEEKIIAADPSEKEIQEAAAKIHKIKAPAKEKKTKKALVPSKAGEEWTIGDTAWVYDKDGEHFLATIIDESYQNEASGEMLVMVQTANDDEWEVALEELSLEKPKAVQPKLTMPKAPAPAKHKKGKAKGFEVGQIAWVDDKEPWKGRIMEILGKNAKLKIAQGFQGAGNIIAVKLTDLRDKQP